MLAAIGLIVGLIVLVFVHELGHFLAAKQAGIKVEEFGFGFPPRMKGWRRGETTYSINWLPFGGFVRIYGENKHRLETEVAETGAKIEIARAFFAQSIWRRFVVIAAGISINFIVGWLLLSTVYMIGAREAVVVTEVQDGSPAQIAKLERGDEIIGYTTTEALIDFTHANEGKKVSFEVRRNNQVIPFTLVLRKATSEHEGPLGAGISKAGFASLGFFSALKKGLVDSVNAIAEIFVAFGTLIGDIFGHAHVPDNIVGPVGIFGIAGDLGKLGFVYILQLIAMISLNLAALNAIPFPALDGGRILFLIIEKIKGSPVHATREQWVNFVSFGFLVLLMLIITGRDIIRLF